MTTVIKTEHLGKKYILRHQQEKYLALRDVITETPRKMLAAIFKRRKGAPEVLRKEEFWALRDVSMEVEQGEKLGIIGRNGAGKTTLLKLLSRITVPSEGRFGLNGRVASLLEVGTGFHPELTGKENIYFNGAVLGMGKSEIDRKFDEIVEFAEVEKFLDTPVKRYSSGMYVRLAFSVAAHLEPEVLLVDEVLAVGDAAFQKKCIGRMGEVAREGRTILFVSHNMGLVRELCDRGIWLNEGRLQVDGHIEEAIATYLMFNATESDFDANLEDHRNRLFRMRRLLKRVTLRTTEGEPCGEFSQQDRIVLDIKYDASEGPNLAGAGFIITTDYGARVGGFNTYMAFQPPYKIPEKGTVRFTLPSRLLNPGYYTATVSLGSHPQALEDKVENCVSFIVHPSDIYKTGYLLTKEDGVATILADVELIEG